MNNAHIELPLIGAGRTPLLFIVITTAVLLIVLAVATLTAHGNLSSDPSALPTAILGALVFCLVPFVVMRVIGRVRACVENGELVLHTGVGSKRVPLSHLRAHGVEVIDLARHAERRPVWRWWGASMPGLSSGWFTLRNGEKAVCLITDRHRVSYLRSDTDNLSLLLSLQNPATLAALLER